MVTEQRGIRARRLVVVAATAWPGIGVLPVTAAAASPPAAGTFQIGLIGDTGYTPAAEHDLLAVRNHMGRLPLAFVVHDGDTQAGETPCKAARSEYVKGVFDGFAAPFIYTP